MIPFFCIFSTAQAGDLTLPSPGATPPPKVDFSELPPSASVRPKDMSGKPHQVHARLLTDKRMVQPGDTLKIGLHLDQDEGWHTYWKSPGTIGKPTVIEWTLPEGLKASAYEYPVPTYFSQSNLVSFGYEKEVLLMSEVGIPTDLAAGSYELEAKAAWLVCKESCIPGSAELKSTFEVGASSSDGPYAELFKHYVQLHPTDPLSIQAFSVETALSASGVRPEEVFQAAIQIIPTSDKPLDFLEQEETWPVFTPIVGDNWMINTTKLEKTKQGGLLITIEGESFEAESLPMNDTFGALLQVKVGDEWIRTELDIGLPLVAKDASTIPSSSPLFGDAERGLGAEQPSASAKETASAAVSSPEEPEAAGAVGMLEAMVLAFLGGMLLNIMPCVLPVITMKLFGLVEQADISAAEQKKAGLAYTAGVVLSFLALALVVVVLQNSFGWNLGWGFQFQFPEYVVALATIVFVFGLSLFGVFEVPAFGSNQAAQASAKEGSLGYLFSGAFATLLATPCSAPFLGTGIGFAFTLPSWGILLFFALAGLGLAFPFLLIAFIPSFFKFLPAPGAWMETFKQFMGFTLIATTVWLVDVLGAQTGLEGAVGFLAFLVCVGISCWIQGRWGSIIETPRRQMTTLLVGVGLSTLAGFTFLKTDFAEAAPASAELTTTLDFSEEIPWQGFTEERVAELRGEAIFIDFTADWCLTCKVNEQSILETERVRQEMSKLGVIPLKADWTRRDEVITKWLQRHGKAGVPLYLVISKQGKEVALPEVITADMVIEQLQKAAL